MTYADELHEELERQIEFRRLPPALMKLIEAYAEARVKETGREIAKLRRDRLTLALRLEGEDASTFAPETAAVMNAMRGEIAEAYMRAVADA